MAAVIAAGPLPMITTGCVIFKKGNQKKKNLYQKMISFSQACEQFQAHQWAHWIPSFFSWPSVIIESEKVMEQKLIRSISQIKKSTFTGFSSMLMSIDNLNLQVTSYHFSNAKGYVQAHKISRKGLFKKWLNQNFHLFTEDQIVNLIFAGTLGQHILKKDLKKIINFTEKRLRSKKKFWIFFAFQ
jgi:hypothetical protein